MGRRECINERNIYFTLSLDLLYIDICTYDNKVGTWYPPLY